MPPETPAAPANAPAPAPVVPTPAPSGPALSATEQASRDARNALKAGATLESLATKPGGGGHPQPIDITGKYASPEAVAPAAPPAPAPEAPAAEAPAPTEGEAPPAEDGEAPAASDTPDELTVELPGRRPGETFSISVDQKETAERLRQLANGFSRGEDARAALAHAQSVLEQAQQLQDQVAIDPVGLLETAPPEVQRQVAMSLILGTPGLWESVRDEILSLDDDERRDGIRHRYKAERLEQREELRAEAALRTEAAKNSRAIVEAVERIAAEAFENEAAVEAFKRTALLEIREFVNTRRISRLPPADLPIVLATQLRAHGIDPVLAAQWVADPAPKRQAAPTASAPTAKGARPAMPAPVKPTAATFQAKSLARKAAAVVPAAGAGSPSSSAALQPPPGQSIAERTAWHRQQLSKGRIIKP